MAAPLFRSLLGADFEDLDPRLRWVHGDSRARYGACGGAVVHPGIAASLAEFEEEFALCSISTIVDDAH